jgi:signal transduction histidine kinase
MSHELRTPLNVILGYAEMAREGDSPLSAQEIMARIERSGRDLLGLIESTLEIGKIDAVAIKQASIIALKQTIQTPDDFKVKPLEDALRRGRGC